MELYRQGKTEVLGEKTFSVPSHTANLTLTDLGSTPSLSDAVLNSIP